MNWGEITKDGDIQRNDPCGDGFFGADRKDEDGNWRPHKGDDVLVVAGAPIFSPIDGFLSRQGDVYGDGTYALVEVIGGGQTIKIMYATALAALIGEPVSKGQQIGHAQEISANSSCGMEDHLHIELFVNGDKIDPAPFLYDFDEPEPEPQNANSFWFFATIIGLALKKARE